MNQYLIGVLTGSSSAGVTLGVSHLGGAHLVRRQSGAPCGSGSAMLMAQCVALDELITISVLQGPQGVAIMSTWLSITWKNIGSSQRVVISPLRNRIRVKIN